MGVRLTNSFKSKSGVVWKIDILDSSWSGAITTFTSQGGFGLVYKQVTERLDPLFASTLTVPIDVNDGTMEQFLIQAVQSQEERISVKVYKDSVLYWVGLLLPDLAQIEDIYYPFTTVLTFTDGLGRLKTIDYNSGGASPTKYTGRETVLAHLLKILEKTGIAALYGNADSYLQTTVNWYDARHAYLYFYCPLAFTKIDHAIFYSYDEEGTIEYMKCDKVLEYILRLFNARVLMAEGKWHVIQPQEYSRPSTFSRVFTKLAASGTSYNAKDFRIAQVNDTRANGGLTKYYAPFRKVTRTYKYRRTPFKNNSLITLPITLYSSTAYPLLSNVITADRIKFTGKIRTWYSATGSFITKDLWAQFLLRIVLTKLSDSSVIYLKNPNDIYQWTSVNSSCTYKVGPYDGIPEWDEEFSIEFTLPPLSGAEYSGTFQFYYNGLYRGPGTSYTLQAGESWNHEILEMKMVVDNSDGESKFTALNTIPGGSLVASNLETEMPETILGDGPLSVSLGRLTTSNLTTYADSTVWGTHNSLSRVKINQLAVNQNLIGQRIPTVKYQGTFINHNISAVNSIAWSGKNLAPLAISIDPVAEEVSGEWFNTAVTVQGGGWEE